MDLNFQVPMQYCSLQHQTVLFDTSHIHNYHFHFGLGNSFLLMLLVIALCSPQVIYWISSNLGVLIFQHHIIFFLFILSMAFSRQEYWVGWPFPCPRPHFVRNLHYDPSTLVTLPSMAHGFIELCKPLCHNKTVIHEVVSSLWFWQ